MAKPKKITKQQLEDYIIECKAFKLEYTDYIRQLMKQLKGAGDVQTLDATEPPKPPKIPPGV